MTSNYYVSSFAWTTIAKVLNAALNFFSIPLLINLWGQGNYGVLALAIACNGYLSLMDMGLNTGAIRYFSIWITQKNYSLLHKVANSNTIFYGIISIINVALLLLIAFCGESWFDITTDQFKVLKSCLIILAIFALPSWLTTSFNQLLVANKQIAFTQKVYCGITLLKVITVVLTLILKLPIENYYFIYSAVVASTVLPYYLKSYKFNLCVKPHYRFYWDDFKPVLYYSLALFALSIFQVTATYSRPIILGIFSNSAANVLAEFKIVEVIPVFILTIGGSITNILLPKSTALIAENNRADIEKFAYNGTTITSILACILCFPFIIGGEEAIIAYVGQQYAHLSVWLIAWCITILIQIHTTPGGSLILSKGKTKVLVYTSALSCVISIIINASLTELYGVGSAIIGYLIYVCIVIGAYYIAYYKTLLNLSRLKMLASFLKPTLLASICAIITYILFKILFQQYYINDRWMLILWFISKSITWLILFLSSTIAFKLITLSNWKQIIK